MRNLRSYALGSGALVLVALGVSMGASSCSSGQAPASGDGGGGTTGSGGSGGSTGAGGTSGSGNEGGTSTNCGTGCYAPIGCDYQVKPLASWNFTNFSVDTSTPVGSQTGAAPIRVRLGLGGGTAHGKAGYADPTTSGVFTWETTEKDTDAKLQIGTSASALTEVRTGYSWTMSPGIGTTLVNLHEVHVCGLKPGTTYYYQVGGGAKDKEVWSATQSFTTVPATGKITVGVMSDARDTVSIWQTVHQRMKSIGVNFQVIPGDIVDFGSEESLYVSWLDAIWKSGPGFLTLGEQLIVPIAGNHEAEAAQFYGNFAIPGTSADAYAKTYASFDAGNTHFIVYDDSPEANMETTEAAAQQAWLRADLMAANGNRSKVPFIVLASHRGLYSTSHHAGDADVLQARGVLAPLFDQYHVDLVLNGHDHEYERSNVLHAGSPASGPPVVVQGNVTSGSTINSTKGTTYVINAGAGADPYAVGTSAVAYRATKTELCVPGDDTYTGTCKGKYYIGCYVILDLEGSQISLTAYGITGSAAKDDVIDSLTLTH
jgi:predicted phosphodiesterase